MLSRPGRSGGDESGFEAIKGDQRSGTINGAPLSPGYSPSTSVGTFAVSTGPNINYRAEAGTKNAPDTFKFFYKFKKGLENRSSHFKLKITLISCSRGAGPPLKKGCYVFCGPESGSEKNPNIIGKGSFVPRILKSVTFCGILKCHDDTLLNFVTFIFVTRYVFFWVFLAKPKMSQKLRNVTNSIGVWYDLFA